jgi:type IV fimbrial biogenesis protein FimT
MVKTSQQVAQGFSLPELMVVIAIMAIVMGYAVPGLRDLMATERVKSASFDLITAAMYARSEAGKRGNSISIKAASSNNLETGWCVIFGTAADCDLTTPAAETMRVQQGYSTVSFTWKTSAGPISFGQTGRLSTQVQLEIADISNTNLKRCVIIDVTGVPSSRSGAC